MKTLIISYNKFPNGDAGAVRDYLFTKMFNKLGFNVCVVGMGQNTNFAIKDYKGVAYVSLRHKGVTKKSRLLNYFGYTKKLFDFMKDYYSDSLPDIIFVVNMPIHSLFSIKKFALKNNIKLIHDSVEWYSPKQFKYGFLSPEFIIKELNNRFIVDKNFQVISISKFLHNYYSEKNISSIRIPVVFDKYEISSYKNISENKLVLIYAGSPGKKDYLYTIVKSLIYLPDVILNKIEFRIIGVNELDLSKMFKNEIDLFSKVKSSLSICGRVPREEVFENLVQADFTVLLRESNLRYAKAGFPTKFVESIASGTPMISNITSDLGDYIKDMDNSIVVDNCDSKSFANALIRAYELKFILKNIKYMQEKARITFETHFHYENYIDDFRRFLID
jgi:glycosyltransferase involved in cell wall biosynthesis